MSEESRLYDRSLRPKRHITTPESHLSPRNRPSYYQRSRLRPRQAPAPPVPAPAPAPPRPAPEGPQPAAETSGEAAEAESESEGEVDSGDEETPNPFAPSGSNATTPSSTTTLPNNPFASGAAVTGTAVIQTGTLTITSSPTSLDILSSSATDVSSPVNNSEDPPPEAKPDKHTTAIALGTLLGILLTGFAAFLLYRYCTPVRTRVDSLRQRSRKRLSGEEDPTPDPQLGGGMVQSGEFAALNTYQYKINGSTMATPAPSYTQQTAIAVPIIRARALPAIPVSTISRDDDLANPFADHAQILRRSDSNSSTKSKPEPERTTGTSDYGQSRPTTEMLGDTVPYPFNFSLDAYRMSGTDSQPKSLIGSTKQQDDAAFRTATTFSVPAGSGLGLQMGEAPQTPQTAHMSIPYAPPSEAATPRTQFTPRQRQSITPSDSVSNAPYSPLPLPMPMPFPANLMNSRWSSNSSSVWTRAIENKSTTQSKPPRKVPSVPPPLPLVVRRSTSSTSSSSSRRSSRETVQDTALPPGRISNVQGPVAQQSSTLPHMPVGLPTSVRPTSSARSASLLQPVTYRP